MSEGSGLFEDASNFAQRFVPDYRRITEIVDALRVLGRRVVLTMGTFDILHEGHSLYLEAARSYGDFLIVGVDSDEKVRQRKGIWRPAVPELERLRMVTHQRGVGLVTLKQVGDPRWALIDAVRPDVLVATADARRRRRRVERYAAGAGAAGDGPQRPAAPAAARAGPAASLRLSEHPPEDVPERLPDLMRDVITRPRTR
jgi:cytidyltransferase-like protein